jgi:hypothetical protein
MSRSASRFKLLTMETTGNRYSLDPYGESSPKMWSLGWFSSQYGICDPLCRLPALYVSCVVCPISNIPVVFDYVLTEVAEDAGDLKA